MASVSQPLVTIVLGTRPEAIKLAPVIRAFQAAPGFRTRVVLTGQHREMVTQVMRLFGLKADHDLALMAPQQTLTHITCSALQGLQEEFAAHRPALVLVQGDTTTAFASALAAFYGQIPVGHVEAGLRTDNLFDPFPEEANRRLISQLAQLHFAPTAVSAANCRASGVIGEVLTTGNTVIDALLLMAEQAPAYELPGLDWASQRVILATVHRRENWGLPMRKIASAVAALLQLHPDVIIVWPMHPNPSVREDIQNTLAALEPAMRTRLCLTDPLDYPALMAVLAHCHFTMTDSGGIQEEASALMRPVLVLRESTERQELVEAGGARLVGTEPSQIVEDASLLLASEPVYRSMQLRRSPFGDGHAAERIAEALLRHNALMEAA